MYSLLLVAFSAFVLSFLLTPLFRNLCRRLGWVDHPDLRRKLHQRPVPRIGGVAIVLACAGSYGVLFLSPLHGGSIVLGALPLAWKLIPSVLFVFAVGLCDDLVGLRPWQKLVGQFVAAALACWAGVQITGIGAHAFAPWLAIPVTLLWLIGCSNAFNLIDGIDGLATGVGLFATITTLIAALLHGDFGLAAATAPLAGALLGFLRYNFNPATIFLGDSGSLSVGFLLGCYGIIWSQKSATLLGMTAPLMALAIPLLDTGLAILRRLLRGHPIFSADRGHIHHRLLDRGLPPRRVALLLYGMCGIAAALSLLQSTAEKQYTGLVMVLFCGAAWLGVQHLGYVEFGAAGRLMKPHTFLRVLSSQLRLTALEDELTAVATPEECFDVLKGACRDFGFHFVILRMGGGTWRHRTGDETDASGWTLRIPLSNSDFVNFNRDFELPVEPMVVASFAEILRRKLQEKSRQFESQEEIVLRVSASLR